MLRGTQRLWVIARCGVVRCTQPEPRPRLMLSGMKRWAEAGDVLRRAARGRANGERMALATVVRVVGSAYRREGARLLVSETGETVGNVSGGCLEADVREVALRVIRSGRPEYRSYCSGADEVDAWDLGVGCEGRVDVYVAPVEAAVESWERERALIDGDEGFFVVTRVEAGGGGGPVGFPVSEPRVQGVGPVGRESPEGLLVEPAGIRSDGRLLVSGATLAGSLGDADLDARAARKAREWLRRGSCGLEEIAGSLLFFDVRIPPPRLVILGAGEDARPLAALAAGLGFRTIVVDRRPGLLDPRRFDETVRLVHAEPEAIASAVRLDESTFVVAMTHRYADDLAYLRVLIGTGAAYIGVLGPRHRTERILGTLVAERPVDVDRVRCPIGLDLGGEGAEAVAVAIMAEIMAAASGRDALPLRDRVAPIHSSAGLH